MSTTTKPEEEKKVTVVEEEPGWKSIGLKIVLPILIFIAVFVVTFFIKMMDSGDLWPQFIEDFVFPTADKNMMKFYFIALNLAVFYASIGGGITYGLAKLA